MKLREPEKQILDDFEHKVTGKIAKYGNEPDFPKFENYGITRMELDDYLFDKQAILDMGGSKRSQLTIGGFITVLPVLVLSCFPDQSPVYDNGKMLATVIAVIIGLLLACFVKALLQMIIAYRVNHHKEPKMETFIKALKTSKIMKLREPEKQILDDFEHKVTGKIAKYGNEPDFPKFENYGITRMELDDYLFDKQAILDMGGSKRSQLTIGGFITVLPVLVLSCFPDQSPVYDNGKMLATVIAVIIGLLLACFVKALLQMIIAYRVNHHKEPKMETFIKAVLFYEKRS